MPHLNPHFPKPDLALLLRALERYLLCPVCEKSQESQSPPRQALFVGKENPSALSRIPSAHRKAEAP